MTLDIVTIENVLYRGKAEKLIAKTAQGEITVLDNHIPLITTLKKAPLKIVTDKGEEIAIDITSGFLEVRPESRVVVLAEN